ncbi:NAD(P)H-binding protein [Nocardioides pelophilus]|uniref:NAD(P)H-binding protein n=1 Tax=Nocardioides pelophilus TaxID=2172019 RepID=UPI001C81BE54|nr:NAD(P)H-binding protein [Nocardioides pelophilus]
MRHLTMMAEEGITRFVATSSQGVAEDWKRVNPVMRGLITISNIKAGFEDHNGVDALMRASDVEWTLARAVALTDRPAKGPLRAAAPGTEKPATFVNRHDLATFLLDTVEQGTWLRQTPVVWNTRN